MKIGLDFDGVFCDMRTMFVNGAKNKFGIEIPENCITGNSIIDKKYLTEIQFLELKNYLFEEDSCSLEMVPGADVACRHLLARGHRLEVLTKRNRGVDIAKRFCKKLGLDIPVFGTPKGKSKSDVSNYYDLFLDDSISNLQDLSVLVPNLVLFSWIYNDKECFPLGTRISSWEEFSREVV